MTQRFTNLDALVPFAKLRAKRGVYDGIVNARSAALIDLCRHQLSINIEQSVLIIFTRDSGHHSSGWWKNPDYENCLHLSLSYQWCGMPAEHDKVQSHRIARAFFDNDVAHSWIEGPYSPEGKARQVWHYRVFTNPAWEPIRPRGEVYNTDWTPADWKSFSEIHGYKPEPEQAPFLMGGQ